MGYSFKVAADELAHQCTGRKFIVVPCKGVQMGQQEIHFIGCGQERFFLSFQKRFCLIEDYRVPDGPSGEHHPVDVRLLKHPNRIFRFKEIARSDKRNGQSFLCQMGFQRGQTIPLRKRSVALGAGPGVEGQKIRTSFNCRIGELKVVPALMIPSYPELHRGGDSALFLDDPDDLPDQRRVFHQCRSRSRLGHFGHGAARVDVDHRRLMLFYDGKSGSEGGKLTQEELDRIVRFTDCPLQQRDRFFPLSGKPFHADHFGIGEIRPSFDAQLAEGSIGIPRQRGKEEVSFEGEGIGYEYRVVPGHDSCLRANALKLLS